MFLDTKDSLYSKIVSSIIYIFVALFPFVMYQGFIYFGTSSRSINLVVVTELLLIIFVIFALRRNSVLSIIKSPITAVLAIFLVITFIASLAGVDFSVSFWSKATRTTGIFYFLHLGIFYLFLIDLFSNENRFKTFLKVYLISAAVFSAGSLLSGEGFNLIYTNKAWDGFTFGNSTFAAMYLYSAFMLSIYYAISSDRISHYWWKFLLPIIFVINPYFINTDLWRGQANIFREPLSFFGGAQTSSYVLFFSILSLFIIWLMVKIGSDKIKKIIFWISVIGTVVVAVFASYSLLSNGGFLQKIYLSQPSRARVVVWELSKKAIQERPVLGWGAENFDQAFELHYDNKLLEPRNGEEGWFDRAHNIFIDQMIESGYVGLIAYLLVYIITIICLLYVFLKSQKNDFKKLSIVLIIYLLGHIIELQTAFDTSISYISLIIVVAIATVIFQKTAKENINLNDRWEFPETIKYPLLFVLVLFFGSLLFIGTVPILLSQFANSSLRSSGSSEKRLTVYNALFNTPIDKETFLWRASYDLQRGISLSPNIVNDSKRRQGFIDEFSLLTKEYEGYLEKNKLNYRAQIQLAETYIYQRLFDIDNLDKAQAVLDQAITLVPNAPQTYWMKAVAYLYQRKFDQARIFSQKAYELNTKIVESKRLAEYIDQSIKTFPEIDFYSFRHI